jgi:type I restriction enzyme S subunit
MDLDFLLYATDAIVEGIANSATQTSVKNVSLKSLATFRIPVPPRDIQQNVSEFLAAVKLRKPRQDWPKPIEVLKQVFSTVVRIEELAAQIHEARILRHQAAEEAEAVVLSALKHLRLPSGTKTKPIGDCSRMSTGTTPPSDRSDFYGGPIQWYTPGDLEYQQRLNASSRTLSELALAERKARMFEPGTVLLVAIGGSLGKVALTHERCSANQQITGIKFSDEILPEYGFWWMRGLGKELMAAAPQATLPIINQERIGAFEISVPPLPEQRRIVSELDALQAEVDALKRLQAETTAELDALLPSILDRAFKCKLP